MKTTTSPQQVPTASKVQPTQPQQQQPLVTSAVTSTETKNLQPSANRTVKPVVKPTVVYKQFPIRLDAQLSFDLELMSQHINIPKSTITRIALKKFLKELTTSGTKDAIENICNQ